MEINAIYLIIFAAIVIAIIIFLFFKIKSVEKKVNELMPFQNILRPQPLQPKSRPQFEQLSNEIPPVQSKPPVHQNPDPPSPQPMPVPVVQDDDNADESDESIEDLDLEILNDIQDIK